MAGKLFQCPRTPAGGVHDANDISSFACQIVSPFPLFLSHSPIANSRLINPRLPKTLPYLEPILHP